MSKTVIKKRAVFADIHQEIRGGELHTFAIKYRKFDGHVGYKLKVSKSLKNLPGQAKYRQNVKLNNVLLLYNHEEKHHFEISTDLLLEYNNRIIDHQP